MTLLPIHILAGTIAIVPGFIALFARKGGKWHRRSGMIFVYAMLILAASGAVMAAFQPNRGNVMGGVVTFYLVTTGLLTMRRRGAGIDWKDVGAMLLGVSAGIAGFTFAAQASHMPNAKLDGYPPPTYFVFGSVALLAAIGDARMIRARGITGAPRLARHLWRMCIAMLIGTGSFFLGKAHLFPKPLSIMPVLASPVILVLLLMVYWLVRLRIKRSASMLGDQSPPTQLIGPIQLGN